MSVLALRLPDLIHEPAHSFGIIFASVVRNLSAEWAFYLQLVLAVGIGLAFDIYRGRSLRARYFSRPVRVDAVYGVLELSHVVQFVIIQPVLLFVALLIANDAPWLTIEALAQLPGWAQLAILFTFTDFCVYWWHRLQHFSAVTWQFHKTHHSQTQLNVLTGFRNTIIDRIVTLVALAIPAAVMRVDIAMPIAIAISLQFHQLLIHSDTGFKFGPLGRIIVSPSFHEVHHSSLEPHLDRNFGGVLTVWDHLFGTYAARGDAELRYGLVGEAVPESWWRQQFVPLVGLWHLYRGRRMAGGQTIAAAE